MGHNRDRYIRYRIYVQSAPKADRNYPRRLVQNLTHLHEKISEDLNYGERDYEEEGIQNKTFIPDNLEHINPRYYHLIGNISRYFDCLALWETTMIKGSTKPINTFTIFGYGQDMLLAYHYITKIINALNSMRFNMTREYRRVKINRRRRGENVKEKNNAVVKSSNFFYRSLGNIDEVTKEILVSKGNHLKYGEKIQNIFTEVKRIKKVDFRKYHYKKEPEIHNAASRKEKFQNKRFITVNF